MPCSTQELGALESLGELLADRLLDHARTGEADQRPRLGDVEVARAWRTRRSRRPSSDRSAPRCKGSRASRSRASAAEIFAICISERIPSCMRAPPEAETTISGSSCSSGALGRAGDLLAHHRAHRAAHEAVLHARR